MEVIQGARLTHKIYDSWKTRKIEAVEIHVASGLLNISLPELDPNKDLEILDMLVDALKKSNIYPYGLTEAKIQLLHDNDIHTVRDLADAKDEFLNRLDSIGKQTIKRFRNVVSQAIWM